MPKKIPSRMCVVCRNMFEKPDLIRVVKGADGVSIDLTGKKAGRGAYVCESAECLKKAQKSRALERALEARIDDAVFEQLAAQIRPQE